jgi:hypothetical protein
LPHRQPDADADEEDGYRDHPDASFPKGEEEDPLGEEEDTHNKRWEDPHGNCNCWLRHIHTVVHEESGVRVQDVQEVDGRDLLLLPFLEEEDAGEDGRHEEDVGVHVGVHEDVHVGVHEDVHVHAQEEEERDDPSLQEADREVVEDFELE